MVDEHSDRPHSAELAHMPNGCCDYHRHVADGCCHCEFAQIDSNARAAADDHMHARSEGGPAEQNARRAAEQEDLPRPWCRDCGPGYRIGDEGCRHDEYGFYGPREEPTIGDEAVCRTCALPIVYEVGEIGHRDRVGWSDRVKRGGDSVVCFKAVGYRHVPMGAREQAIYRAGVKAGQAGDDRD